MLIFMNFVEIFRAIVAHIYFLILIEVYNPNFDSNNIHKEELESVQIIPLSGKSNL